MKIVIVSPLAGDPSIIHSCGNGIKVGQLMMHLREMYGYCPINLRIRGRCVIDIPFKKKAIKYAYKGCLVIHLKLSEEVRSCHEAKHLAEKTANIYCFSLHAFNYRTGEDADRSYTQSLAVYNEYLTHIRFGSVSIGCTHL